MKGLRRPGDGLSPSLRPWIADAEPAGNAVRSLNMAPTAAIVPFWPVWTRTLDDMTRRLARARSRCRRCQTLMHVDLDALHRQLGGSTSLINRIAACPIVGCAGRVYYLGAAATGAVYHVLVDEPALLEGVTDPMGTPFRPRWHNLVSVVTDFLPSPAGTQVIVWPGGAD